MIHVRPIPDIVAEHKNSGQGHSHAWCEGLRLALEKKLAQLDPVVASPYFAGTAEFDAFVLGAQQAEHIFDFELCSARLNARRAIP